MPESLNGAIERITFHNLDTGYCVLRVRVAGQRDPVTVVGFLVQAVAGEFIEATGTWVTDRVHGPQYRADTIKTVPPHTTEGIVKYLGSGLVKGIGPTYARKIVDVFGRDTLEIIDKSPTYLAQVKGIGPKRLKLIREGWEQTRGVRAIMTFLMSYGLGTARAAKIYKTYGENAIAAVTENPYRLSEEIWGVGFRTADELAMKLGLPRDAPQRADAAVQHVLREASTTRGHVGLPDHILIEETVALTNISGDAVREAIARLQQADQVVVEDLIYPTALYHAELGLAERVQALCRGTHPLTGKTVPLEALEQRLGLQLSPSQRKAVQAALQKKVLIVTGGPGTGKTTIVRAILEAFLAARLLIGLCAPTGRAAKRLTETTGREARTIHRLLEFDAATMCFRKNQDDRLDLDLLVVDEASMLDLSLAHKLFQAIPPGACVLLVGDIDQLPSVGAGAVLQDLIQSRQVAVARLTEVHRQAEASDIVRAAHAVHRGEEPQSAAPGQGDFYIVEADDPATIQDRILTMVKERIPARFGLHPVRDIQVLSPMNKSELGVQNLNALLQNTLNPTGPGKHDTQRYGTTYRVGDKVLQTRNNYTREVFNGDIGRITAIDPIDQVATVDFDGRGVFYDLADLDELQLGYAITIHKSQGSEYPAVVIPVHTQHYVMLQRNLLYTALTRGRKLVVLVGSRKALWLAINRAETVLRYSRLSERLQKLTLEH